VRLRGCFMYGFAPTTANWERLSLFPRNRNNSAYGLDRQWRSAQSVCIVKRRSGSAPDEKSTGTIAFDESADFERRISCYVLVCSYSQLFPSCLNIAPEVGRAPTTQGIKRGMPNPARVLRRRINAFVSRVHCSALTSAEHHQYRRVKR
jgi:hypothetical protein